VVPAAEADPATAALDRFAMLSYAVNVLKANAGTKVYLDRTHTGWLGAGDSADRLLQAGVGNADGFFLNVSNYQADERRRGGSRASADGSARRRLVPRDGARARPQRGAEPLVTSRAERRTVTLLAVRRTDELGDLVDARAAFERRERCVEAGRFARWLLLGAEQA
jgi:hypothetical protein